jgi:hypothetical protein
MVRIYDVNWSVLVHLLLPTFLRRPVMTTFMKCFVSPISHLHNYFVIARREDLFREAIDCTVTRLEFLLNTLFYPHGLDVAYDYRIRIASLEKRNVMRIWLGGVTQETDEGKSRFLNPAQCIYLSSEAGEVNVDFVVKVPAAVVFDESRMRAILKCYALPGKTFEIFKY